jgi:hypothetical protein
MILFVLVFNAIVSISLILFSMFLFVGVLTVNKNVESIDILLTGIFTGLIILPGIIIFFIFLGYWRNKLKPWMWRIQVLIEFPLSFFVGLAILAISIISKSFYLLGALGVFLSLGAILAEDYLLKSEMKKTFYLSEG